MTVMYHERTKHRPGRYARSAGFPDWENEPDPFRRYEGSALHVLPLSQTDPTDDYGRLYDRGVREPLPFTVSSIGSFLELSLGLSAWKSYGGSSWALRMNPSSGNLHPTEAYLLLPPLSEEMPGGVFHYTPFLHALEQRAVFNRAFWKAIEGHFGAEGFFIGLSSVCWREAWKYGERAFRYCQLDVGHAMACVSLSANLQGWKAICLSSLPEEEMEVLLGFSQTTWTEGEEERPDLILFISRDPRRDIPRGMPPEITDAFARLSFSGRPNTLSRDHMPWDLIGEVSASTERKKRPEEGFRHGEREFLRADSPPLKASEIIRQRRSGQAYDGKTGMDRDAFLIMLDRTIARDNRPPFDAGPEESSVHLLLFVHRVRGMEQGLYILVRNEKDLEDLKERFHVRFLWERAAGSLPLYLLERGDLMSDAALMSCGQDIAGDGAFAVAMIGRFRERIERDPHSYRTLHWEAGMIGQVLYLEAEAHALRGTGMGCFFDDLVHRMMGLKDNTYQDLYHFTVGRAVEDKRLTTLPPYHHLKEHSF